MGVELTAESTSEDIRAYVEQRLIAGLQLLGEYQYILLMDGWEAADHFADSINLDQKYRMERPV